MNDDLPPPGAPPDADALAEAKRMLDAVIRALGRKVKSLEADEAVKVAEALALTQELRRWALVAFEEREKVEKRMKDRGGIVHDHSIDFDEARAQIGRRLARLRAAGGAGGVSG
jgi:hypothetical protein